MASLLKRGGVWTARVFLDGQDRWRSLRTGDRQEAERRARELESAIKGRQWLRRQLDDLLLRASKEVRPDEAPLLCESVAGVLRRLLELVPADRRDPLALALSRSLVEQQERKLAISDGWDTWLSSANRASAPKELTLRNYGAQWRRFAAWAAGRDLRWFHEIDEAAVLAYADDLWASRITARTFNAHLQFLRSVWATLRVTAGLAADNPWSTLKAKAAGPDAGRRDLTLVQKTLGHSTAGMTAHYTHTDTASARQVLAPLAEIMTGNHTAAL